MSTRHHGLAQTTVTMFVFLELNFLLLLVSIKIGKHSLVYLMELCTLPKVQKLYYLKGALKGEAKRVLSDLPTTGANYDAAIQLLKD